MIRPAISNPLDSISRWETPQLLDAPAQQAACERTLEELQADAMARGHAEGFQQGQRQAAQLLQQRLQQIDVLLQALASPFGDLHQQVLDTLVQLAGRIARSLVKRELHTAPDTIMALVRDTVAILNMPASIVNIHLHPEDARLLQELTSGADNTRWHVIDDPMIARGDCKVSCQDSIVDGNLQGRINAVITQFQGDERG